jgi:hypothetical protein
MLSLSCLRVLLLGLAVTTSEAIPAGRRNTDSDSTVDLGYAVYQGSVNSKTNVQSFKGIRYAAPPLGKPKRQLSVNDLRLTFTANLNA